MNRLVTLFIILFIFACGQKGDPGNNGPGGIQGAQGFSTVFTVTSASPVQCPAGGIVVVMALDSNQNNVLDSGDTNITTSVVCNGQSASPYTPVAMLNPCGNAPGIYNEVLLKLSDGTVLSSFSDNANGLNTRFSIIGPGTYSTTDGDNCVFTLDSNGNITYESHHD